MRWPWQHRSALTSSQAPRPRATRLAPMPPAVAPAALEDSSVDEQSDGAFAVAYVAGRERVVSRPRVARAAAAAAATYHDGGKHTAGTIGTSTAGASVYLVRGRPMPTPSSGPLVDSMPALAQAAAVAARASGRTPEEVWAEALHIWLEECAPSTREGERDEDGRPISPLRSPSRTRAWQEIERTLSALRVS